MRTLSSFFALPLTGCAFMLNIGAGAALTADVGSPGASPPEPEVLASLQSELSFNGLGLGLGAQTRAGRRGFEFGAGPEVCVMPNEGRVTVSLCAGFSMLTLGLRDDAFSLGALSPHIQPIVAIPLGARTINTLFVSLPVGYDLRFTDQPDSLWAGVQFGVGWSLSSGRAKAAVSRASSK